MYKKKSRPALVLNFNSTSRWNFKSSKKPIIIMEVSLKIHILTLTKDAIVIICDSTRSEICGLIPLVAVRMAKFHFATPCAISLPCSPQLVKFIPNFTPARAITYKNTRKQRNKHTNISNNCACLCICVEYIIITYLIVVSNRSSPQVIMTQYKCILLLLPARI